MAVILVRASIPNITGLAKDMSVNDFVFNSPSSTAAAMAAVEDFYNGAHSTNGVAFYMNASLSRTASGLLEAYDITTTLGGAPHGSPTVTSTWSLGAVGPGTTALPDQMAAVVSYHADYAGALETGPSGAIPTPARAVREGAPATHTGRTRPKSTLRGRVYIGPCTVGGINAAGQMSSGFYDALSASGVALTASALGWAVWSRRTASVHDIIGGWVDDALGVQRRRNTLPRAKTPWVGFP